MQFAELDMYINSHKNTIEYQNPDLDWRHFFIFVYLFAYWSSVTYCGWKLV